MQNSNTFFFLSHYSKLGLSEPQFVTLPLYSSSFSVLSLKLSWFL